MPSFGNLIDSLTNRGLAATLRATANTAVGAAQKALGQRFVERQIYSYRMLLDLQDLGISRTLLLFGERELEHKIMLERVLKAGMTVLDIGANIGYYALMELELIGQGGRLIAVEPSPSNAELLKRNLALNGYRDVEIHAKAVSDRTSTRTFFLSEMSNLNTFHETGSAALHLKGKTIEVETTTVPLIMSGRPLDLIRMDVEGHEIEVLSGLLPAIEHKEMAPMIIFETHGSRYSPEHDIAPPLRRLFALGYRAALVGSSSEEGTKKIEARGYRGSEPIVTDDVKRVIFENLRESDVLDLVCRTGGIRTVLLSR